MQLLKVHIWNKEKGLIDFQVIVRGDDGQIVYGHCGNCPKGDFDASLQELLEKMAQGPEIKAPKTGKE